MGQSSVVEAKGESNSDVLKKIAKKYGGEVQRKQHGYLVVIPSGDKKKKAAAELKKIFKVKSDKMGLWVSPDWSKFEW